MRISFSDDTPNGSGETIRNSLWTAALTAALQKKSALQGVRISLDFRGGMDGPSAGAVMCLGIMSALDGRDFPDDFAMTGIILPDGTIGLVGGIPEKLDAAAKNPKIKRVAIPAFQRFARNSSGTWVDLFELGSSLGLEILPVESIGDAYRFLHREKPEMEPLVSVLSVCREDTVFEANAADTFQRRDAALRNRIEGLSSNDLETVMDRWEWDEINPAYAEQRFEEGAIFDALNLIARADACLSAYLESWKIYRDFEILFLDREQNADKAYFEKHIKGRPKEEWPIKTQLAFVDGFRAEINDLCERVLGWTTDDDGIIEDGSENAEDNEPWRGFVPDAGSSDVSAQLQSLVLEARAEGQYRFMEWQTFDRSDLVDALKNGDRTIYHEIDYDRKKLFFLMYERFRKPSFTGVPLPILNAGPETDAAMELFRNAWLVVDRNIDTDVVGSIAENATAHKDAVRKILIGTNIDFAIYDAAKHWGLVMSALLDESRSDGMEFDYPSWTETNFLFLFSDLFAEASAQLLELDNETDNTSFTAFVIDRARLTALRSMSDCRNAGVPCFGAVLSFQKAERDRVKGKASATSVLANYWKSTMTAKALDMAFRNGTGPGQGFVGYAEPREVAEAKAAESALLGFLLNAEIGPVLDAVPPSMVKALSTCAAAAAQSSDEATWTTLRNVVHHCGILLLRQSVALAELTFDDSDDNFIPKDMLESVIRNWGGRLLGIARVATREKVAAGNLVEALVAPRAWLKNEGNRLSTLPIPSISASRNPDGSVAVSVPEWDDSSTLYGLFNPKTDVYLPFEGKMVLFDLIPTDPEILEMEAVRIGHELFGPDLMQIRFFLQGIDDILKKASVAENKEELRAILNEIDLSSFFLEE